jgi:hypothetical protein
LSDFNENLNFLDRFSKNIKIFYFMKIRPVGAELLRADGRTDTTKLTVAFYNFATAPEKDLKRKRLRRCEGGPTGAAEATAAV